MSGRDEGRRDTGPGHGHRRDEACSRDCPYWQWQMVRQPATVIHGLHDLIAAINRLTEVIQPDTVTAENMAKVQQLRMDVRSIPTD